MPRKRSHPNLQKMTKESCRTKEGSVYLTLMNWRIRYFMRLTSLLIPFTYKGIRCTKTSRQPIGGIELREMVLSMLLFVTHVRESKPSINNLLDCCNPCKYLNECGKRLLRILLWDCLGLSLENDFLWVIVDRLAKVAHFVPINMTYTGRQLAELYSSRIVCFYGVPMRIASNRETQVISKFWERLHETLDTHWNFSSTYHPQINGQPRE
jgi:hypothetical protein